MQKSKNGEDTGLDEDEGQNKTLVTSSQLDTWKPSDDADSERHILAESGPMHIRTTTEVTVQRG